MYMCVHIYTQQRLSLDLSTNKHVCVTWFYIAARVAYLCLFRKNEWTSDMRPLGWPHWREPHKLLPLSMFSEWQQYFTVTVAGGFRLRV